MVFISSNSCLSHRRQTYHINLVDQTHIYLVVVARSDYSNLFYITFTCESQKFHKMFTLKSLFLLTILDAFSCVVDMWSQAIQVSELLILQGDRGATLRLVGGGGGAQDTRYKVFQNLKILGRGARAPPPLLLGPCIELLVMV